MYSPVARPSSSRAAPAKKRSWSTIGPISSSNIACRGLPASFVSQSVISSARSWNASASFSSSSWRCPGVVTDQPSKALRAACAARLTSSSVESGECAITSPLAGLTTSSVFPSAGATNSPPIMFCSSNTSVFCFSAVAVSITPPWSGFLFLVEHLFDRGVLDANSLGDGRVGDPAVGDVDAEAKPRVASRRSRHAMVGEREHVRQGRVGERVSRGDRYGTRHVGDAVMRHAVDLEGRVSVGGGVRGLEAAALVDRHVHQHGLLLHQAELLAADDERSACAMDEHGPD